MHFFRLIRSGVVTVHVVIFGRGEICGDMVAMQSIIAGLDRGLLATANDETAADMAARKLEAAGDPVELPRDLELLQGRWRLVFTSGFATGSLGGERPGPPVGRLLPLTLGQVCEISTLGQFFAFVSLLVFQT